MEKITITPIKKRFSTRLNEVLGESDMLIDEEQQSIFRARAYFELNKMFHDIIWNYTHSSPEYRAFKHDLIQKLRTVLTEEV